MKRGMWIADHTAVSVDDRSSTTKPTRRAPAVISLYGRLPKTRISKR